MAALPAAAAPPTSKISWSGCYRDLAAEFAVTYECTTVGVPLDYSQPNGAAVQLALVRLPATGPAPKLGSLFLNPGGPGGSGVDFALFYGPFADTVWGATIRQRFDIVGFDPRGVGRSTAIKCFGNEKQAFQAFAPLPFPTSPDQIGLFEAADGLLADQCGQRGNKIADHMSTGNVARDLDRLRVAVGDQQLTYVGLSYGSYLGVTYANMFPDRVRSLVVDGVLDPLAWSNTEAQVPFSTRLRSDQGAQQTLYRFFQLCDAAGPGCAFAPHSADRYAALAQRLRTGPPVPLQDPDTGQTFSLGYQDLIGITLGSLYDSYSFPSLAELLAALEAAAAPTALGTLLADLSSSTGGLVNKRGFPHYQNFAEAFPAVACEDSTNPSSYDTWFATGVASDAAFGYFGSIWTWASSPCAQWPLTDPAAYRGPYTAPTANPVLVIGNLYDPATRYQGAVTVRSLLPNSALITVDAAGHTSLGLSACAGSLTGQYLLDPSTAPTIDGTFCPQEFNPFDPPAVAANPSAAPADLRSTLMKDIAFRPIR
jgi:pimeloyl-ACP methyl ester carboxylesterase